MDSAQHSSHSSTSSAIELVVTGQASPSLLPSGDTRNSFARRRLSWGRLDSGQDPLRLDSLDMNDPGPSSHRSNLPSSSQPVPLPTYSLDDDPFVSHHSQADTFRSSTTSTYGDGAESFPYSTHHPRAGNSTASLISSNRESSTSWGTDSEHIAATVPRTRHRTQRYSLNLSPIDRSGTTIKRISQSLRRVSLRVVNFAGAGLEDHIRLPGNDYDGGAGASSDGKTDTPEGDNDGEEKVDEQFTDLSKIIPLRGRTLGIFGPTSRVRLAMYDFLIFPWTEPAILCLILLYAILLSIQASRTLTLSNPNATPPPVVGFFHAWEDHLIFVLFIFFRNVPPLPLFPLLFRADFSRSLEAFARICVSGLVLDPEVPFSAIFTSLFSGDDPLHPTPTVTIARSGTLTSTISSTNLSRKGTLLHRIQNLYGNVTRPFALSNNPSFGYESSSSPVGTTSVAASSVTLIGGSTAVQRPSHKRADTSTTLLEKTPSSSSTVTSTGKAPLSQQQQQEEEMLALPFQFSMVLARDITRRNLPYLRHSWTRIDALSVIAFWITFVLAHAGVEHGSHHIGLFRALSVLRTARLLAITSGTTTIMRSLKTARPLLASVAYFVLFAVALFSYVVPLLPLLRT
ncbi:hypothetical protein B0F90DRAFT_1767226 [Multifurca ochricompacta]|uniref:Ion transport domain-containing protein n=1 Tax=Multifurca ochricompacta TaxID=376703 RepID=A0AAD4LWH2_9AGAM|nr:hypothetical protein B0F90DRAFT_1767226 [Multifurca ochricompacta]